MDVSEVRKVVDDERRLERAAGLLKALGHPVRLRVAAELCARGETSVGDLCRDLGVSQPALSQQLSVLRLHGLVTVRRAGGFRLYTIALPQTEQLLHCISTCKLVLET